MGLEVTQDDEDRRCLHIDKLLRMDPRRAVLGAVEPRLTATGAQPTGPPTNNAGTAIATH